jgi:AraC-like DNA-binding protein
VSVSDYLQTGARLIGSVTSGARFWFTLEGDLVRVHQFYPGRAGAGRCQGDLYVNVVTISMLRRFLGPDWSPRQVCLLASDPGTIGDGAAFGDAQVCLNQGHSSFTLPRSLLAQAIPGAARVRRNAPSTAPLLKPEMPAGFLEKVEELVRSLLIARRLEIAVVAEAAGTSIRSLQRHIRAAGFSYSEIVEMTRTRIASEWLGGSEIPIAEIAEMLGYSDAAHFSRAFRRKSGIAPLSYRRQHQ